MCGCTHEFVGCQCSLQFCWLIMIKPIYFMAYSLFHQNMLLLCVGISHSFSVQEMLVKLPNCTEILYQTKNSNENAI